MAFPDHHCFIAEAEAEAMLLPEPLVAQVLVVMAGVLLAGAAVLVLPIAVAVVAVVVLLMAQAAQAAPALLLLNTPIATQFQTQAEA